MSQIIKVKGNVENDGHIHLDLNTTYPPGEIEVSVLINSPLENNQKKYDFSDLEGKLNWDGDALSVQRQIRDEWK